ncbi:MAG: histidine kinase, partial [Pedobacter sp.]
DPHFLFNTLNGLKTLIRKDPEKAEQYAIEVSGVYRYLLRHNRNTTVTLEEELKFLEAYTSLLTLRFEDNFRINLDIDPAFNSRMIFPMSLQLLVENAIKHNVVTSQHPLLVQVYIAKDQIIVENLINLRSTTDGISQYGLFNLNTLYQLHYNKEIEIFQYDGVFKVSLPIL